MGGEDRIVTPAYGEGWRDAIPGARLEIIPQAGHFRIGNSRKPSSNGYRHSLAQAARQEERPMRVWYFSEMAYHPAWEEGLKGGSLRVVLPNRNFDPKVGHGLLNRYLDEFALCDEVGLDIMVNEHHSTSTCLTVSVPMARS